MNRKFWLTVVGGALSLVIASGVNYAAHWCTDLSKRVERVEAKIDTLIAVKQTKTESKNYVSVNP